METGNRYRTILVPVDGSEKSLEAVRYAGKISEPDTTKLTLFHVTSSVPKSFQEHQSETITGTATVLRRPCKYRIEKFLKRASAALHQQGFPSKNVKQIIHTRERGVASDILSESLRGYDAIAIGRWRYQKMKNQIMGGTANKIVNNLYNIPVWIVGKWTEPGRILIAMDDSAGAMRAFTYARKMRLIKFSEILFYSAIRNCDDPMNETERQLPLYQKTEGRKPAAAEFEKNEEEMRTRFARCLRLLKQTEGRAIYVKSKVDVGTTNKAEGIIRTARHGGYGTIIMGRRGLSNVTLYSMGRVCQAVVKMAMNQVVCIVN